MSPTFFAVCPHDTAKGVDKWALFNTLVNKTVGLRARFNVFLNFNEFTAALEEEQLLWAYLNPADYLKAKARFGYEAIARPRDRRDKAYLVAPCGMTGGLELATGKRLAAVKGYLYALAADRLKAAGIQYTLVPAKSYNEVMTLLERGDADVGVSYNDHFDALSPSTRERYCAAESIDVGLSHVVAAHPSVAAESKEALRGFLLGATETADGQKALAALGLAGFDPVPEAPFQVLEQILAAAGA